MPLAAIYLRLSRNEEQLNIDEVLSNHRNSLTKLAKQFDLTYDVYQEISSGVNTDRTQLNLLLSKIELYEYLLVMDIDRISRDNAHAEEIKKILILHDIKILTPAGQIDFTQETNEMLFSFQAMMANFEYKQIRKRLGRGRLAAAEQGRWTMSNKVPLGYKKDHNQRLMIYESEAKIIRFIFQKTLEKVSANEIAKQLDTLGWRSRQGKVLTTSHISQIRRNVVYRGVISASRRINGRIVDSVYVENAHEPIIPEHIFLEVQELLEKNTQGNFFHKQKAIRKLQNLLFCNCCGRKRYIQTDKNNNDYVKSCIYKIDNNKCNDKGCKYGILEKFVLQKLKEKRNEIFDQLCSIRSLETSELCEGLLNQKYSLKKQIDKLLTRHSNLNEMRMDGEITKDEYKILKEQNEAKIESIQKQIEQIDIQLTNISSIDHEEKNLEKIMNTLNQIDTLDPELTNSFLKSFIKKIHFSSNSETNHNTSFTGNTHTVKIEWL